MLPVLLLGSESWSNSASDLEPVNGLLGRARRLIVRRGRLGRSDWRNRTPGPPRAVRVLRETARRLIAIRRLTFVAGLAAGGNCTSAEEVLWARIPEAMGRLIGAMQVPLPEVCDLRFPLA